MAPASAPQAPAPVTPFCNIHVRPSLLLRCPLAPGARIALPDALAHHALRVLRLRAGEAIVLFDGKGGEYPAVLETEGKTGYAHWGRSTPGKRSQPAASPWSRPAFGRQDGLGDRKAVELGAVRVVPVAAQRSVLQLTGPRLESGWPTGNASPNRPVSNAAAIAS